MARFPCDYHGGRYQGAQQTLYPAIVNGGDVLRGKRRACPDCLNSVSTWIIDHLVDGEDPLEVDDCCICNRGEPEEAIFVTVYRQGEEREDWFGRCHAGECALIAWDTLYGPAQGLQPS